MILTHRKFEREEASKEAKSIYIFCEGVKRETQYFRYFVEMDSRINLEIYPLHPSENNSPLGLLEIAKKCIIQNENNPKPKYAFQKNDEVWIVFDTDKDKDNSRKSQIDKVREECKKNKDWYISQSNPCFEVWLYYHFESTLPDLNKANYEYCKTWKKAVNEFVNGGFDSRKHPIYIRKATLNAEKNFSETEYNPNIGSTEVFNLSKSILPIINLKLNRVLEEIGENFS